MNKGEALTGDRFLVFFLSPIVMILCVLLGLTSEAGASTVVFLDFSKPSSLDGNFEKAGDGGATGFAGGGLVKRLDGDDGNGQDDTAAIAAMIMADIKTNLEALYFPKEQPDLATSGNIVEYWIRFVTTKPTDEELGDDRLLTVDFPGNVFPVRAGRLGNSNKDTGKSWVYADRLADKKVWFHDAEGNPQDRELNKAEVTSALSQMAAHEAAHLIAFHNHPRRKTDKPKAGETKSPGAMVATLASSGVMSTGIFTSIDGLRFTKQQEKLLKKMLGTSTTNANQGLIGTTHGTKVKRSIYGDFDLYGTDSGGVLFGSDDIQTLDPLDITQPDGDGTDELLPLGVTIFGMQFEESDVGVLVDSVFLALDMFGYQAGSIRLGLEGFDITSLLDTAGLEGAALSPQANAAGSVLLDVTEVLTVFELEQILADGRADLDVEVLNGFAGTVAFDGLEMSVVMVPEPSGVALLTLSVVMLVRRRG